MRDTLTTKNLQLPLWLRVLEGITTNMLIGYWWAGGPIWSPLSFLYLLHWIASFRFHVHPCRQHFTTDKYLISMVSAERLVCVYQNHGAYLPFLLFSQTDFDYDYSCFVKIVFVIFFLNATQKATFFYNMVFASGALAYVFGDISFHHQNIVLKSYFHILFHLCMTYASYLEVAFYTDLEKQHFDLVRLMVYNAFLYHFAVRTSSSPSIECLQ